MTDLQILEKTDLKSALPTWCEKNDISITKFAEKMGYTYAHAWSILRGKVPVSVTVVGQFVLAFGLEAARELLDSAGVNYGYRMMDSDMQVETVLIADVK